MAHLNRTQPLTKQMARRQLGGIESMYNFYQSRGTDVLTMMTRVESVYPVHEPAVRWALESLMARHPLLRTSITHDQSSEDRPAVFVERNNLELDFLTLDRSDWLDLILEEVHKPFDNRKPLWRCRLLNAANVRIGLTQSVDALQSVNGIGGNNSAIENEFERDVYKYQSVFVFISHHSIMDGGYIMWIFQEFINCLDAYMLNTPFGTLMELPFLPAIEDCIQCPQVTGNEKQKEDQRTNQSNCQLRLCYESANTTAIDDYTTKFDHEIKTLSNVPAKNEILFFKFSMERTSAFMRACSREKCKPPGALTAASILGIIDLIYPPTSTSEKVTFEIPFEFLVDLRRHYRIDNLANELVPYYPGVATSHISLSVRLHLERRPVRGPEFWKIARCFAGSLQDLTVSPNPVIIEMMNQENDSFTNDPEVQKQTGKSPYLLCLSSMGKLDNVIQDNLQERIRLTDVHGHSSTLIDHMPVFFVTTTMVKGHLTGNVSYCKSYTSANTALSYMRHMQHYIDQTAIGSKL